MPDPTNLTIYTSSRAGTTPTMSPADANGNTFSNSGEEFVLIQNEDVTDTVVTISAPKTVDGLAVASRTVTVPDGEAKLIGPFPVAIYNNGANKVTLTYDKVSDLAIVVLKKGVS